MGRDTARRGRRRFLRADLAVGSLGLFAGGGGLRPWSQQPTEYDRGINLKTASTLGLAVPQSVLLQATEVLQ